MNADGRTPCHEVEEHIADVVEGTAPAALLAHVAECDTCRDLRFDAEQARALIGAAGGDFRPSSGFAGRVLEAVLAARPDGPGAPRPIEMVAPSTTTAPAEPTSEAHDTWTGGSVKTDLDPLPRGLEEGRIASAPATIVDPFDTTRIDASALAEHRAARTGEGAPSSALPRSGDGGSVPGVRAVTGRELTEPGAGARAGGEVDQSRSNASEARRGGVVGLFRNRTFQVGLAGAMAAAAAVGGLFAGKDPKKPDPVVAETGWSAEVAVVARAGQGAGLAICNPSCADGAQGARIAAGATVKTDDRTRAQLTLSDGSELVLDRGTELTIEPGDARSMRVVRGHLVVDVRSRQGASAARIVAPQGSVATEDGKLALTVTERRASAELLRGDAALEASGGFRARLRAGEEATLDGRREPAIVAASTLSDVAEWASGAVGEREEAGGLALRGMGELRAKKPGEEKERVRAVRLAKHAVKVRVVDVVARTEVDETFTNDTDDELEGIFRFPLPPGAQIERLALEVDGKLVEGAFVDRDKGAAIWRGVIQNAAPKAPKPREEIIWVPGPWRDPALLEWQRGGRFELKIFPIPKRGSRRVVLTYTQTVPQSAGIRRLNYPLAHDASGTTKIDDFELDVQVLGHDRELGVEPRGYALTRSLEGQAERLVLREQGFVPAGDLTLEYALPSRDAELTAWAYDPRGAQAPVVATPTQVAPGETAADVEARALVSDTSPYVAIALRPKLPKLAEGRERLHVLVVDSSRSMVGERYSRATRLASELVRSMDRRDQFVLLACDVECQAMGTGARGGLATPSYPGADGAAEVERFLGTIEPDGGSNLLAAVEAARTAAGAARDREIRVIYLGDGTPTVGPTRPSTVEAAVGHALPPGEGSIVAVALGADADTTSLAALARGGGGVVVPFVPGQSTRAAARGVLAAADGAVLRDVQIELPPGLTSVSPARIDPFVAGSEAFVFARMTQGTEVRGDVVVRGRVGSAPFEQRTPATIVASTSAGNAFVPRLFAASRIAELELSGNADDRARIVALSKQFQVASRHTSLLVLESEAMFKAFGLDRVASGPTFTGETEADSASADAKGGDANADADAAAVEEQSAALDDALDRSKSKKNDAPRAPAKGASAFGNAGPSGGGRASSQDEGFASPPPAPATPAPAVTSSTESKAPGGLASEPGWSQPSKSSPARRRPPQSLVPMRKVFDRKASFSPTNTLAAELGTKIAALEGEQRARPDSRDRTLALYQALMASGRVGEAQELTARWSQRDALDPEALLARADLAAMRGDRSRALRILSGLADVRPGDKTIPARLASAYAALGDATRACPFRITLAELDANDRTRAAEAVRCSQDRGLSEVASALVAGLPQARRAEVLTQSLRSDLVVPTVVAGDVRVTARWSGGSDLDLALVDKNGRRISWLGSTVKTILPSSKDVASTSTETLAVAGLPGGNYVVEVVRSDATGSRAPIAGELVFSLPGGESRVVPFQLAGERVEVGTIRVFFASRLVPVGGWSDQRSREW